MRQTGRRTEPKNLDAVREQHFIENGKNTNRPESLKNKNRKTLKIAIILFVIAIALVLFVVLKQNTNLFGSKQIAEMQGVEEEYFEEDNIKEENIQENNSEETLSNEAISTYATKASEGYKIYGEQPFTEEYSM